MNRTGRFHLASLSASQNATNCTIRQQLHDFMVPLQVSGSREHLGPLLADSGRIVASASDPKQTIRLSWFYISEQFLVAPEDECNGLVRVVASFIDRVVIDTV